MLNIKEKKTILVFITIFLVLNFTSAICESSLNWTGALYVKGKIGLRWQAVEGISEYSILRKEVGGDFTNLTTVNDTKYFDTSISPGKVYVYKIQCLTAAGEEISSEEKKVSVPGVSGGDFNPPNFSGLRIERDKIMLRWDEVPGAIAYNLYRSTTSGSNYQVIGNITTNNYADKEGLVKGETYYYVATALNDQFDETEFSEEQAIKYGQTADEIAAQEQGDQIELVEIDLDLLHELSSAEKNDPMNQPADVFVNTDGDVYVTDALKCRVNCYDSDGKFRFSFGEATAYDEVDNPPTGSFSYPFTLFIDKANQVYVTDVKNNDIQVFTRDGKFVKRIKVKKEADMEEFRPNGIYVLDDGRIVATDAGNHRFVILDQDGKVLFSIGSRGSDPGQFIFPDELTITKDNTICIVDAINCRIQEFDMEGNFIRTFGEAGQTVGTFGRPKAIIADDNNQLWISDALANAIQVFTLEGEIKSVINKFDSEDIFLATPRGIFIKDGRLYVVNRLLNKVLVFKIM